MARLNPWMRLKVKGDTFYLPDPNGGVYFRNNSVSFRIEGRTIHQWVEKMIPVLNGEYTLEELTEGLPDPYRDRVYEIAETLYDNGFVRDVSQDRPHHLADTVRKKYASQMEFLDHFNGSGGYHFQSYRQRNILAIGCGPFFVSLVAALLESGLPQFHMLITDSMPTHRQRLEELVNHVHETDPEVELKEITLKKRRRPWREVVQPYDAVLYVTQEDDVEELRELHKACRDEKKVFIPALCLQQVGIAGPLVHPASDGCWESAWRRIHRSALCKDPQLHTFSSTAEAMLANVMVFEWFKTATGVTQPELNNRFFLLDLETMEGNWHAFMPHPLVTGQAKAEWVEDLDSLFKEDLRRHESDEWLSTFHLLTSEKSGIFHLWEEGDLKQLPLAQCRVQVADPLSEGPAELLSDIVCTGLTHEEARREAGLTGIEAYMSRLAEPFLEDRLAQPLAFVGVGAGRTMAGGVCRGLQKCLLEELSEEANQKPTVFPVQLGTVEDERCRFYLQALTTMQGEPKLGLGKKVSGFPVVWVGLGDYWYGNAGLNTTLALRKALQQTLSIVQNQATGHSVRALEVSTVLLKEESTQTLVIPSCKEAGQSELLQTALQILKRNQKRLMVFELVQEPFLKEKQIDVVGVLLRREESQ
ncbi:putative thiazole-containing bacteriocin maturation protein [Salinithrix halophila]|uniref:Thiazole-containing bacteriocin maturation protein n=1 Tax=Salinithrix halophila TaxID=1485204 RepID=A0ABV8JE81_9BACL